MKYVILSVMISISIFSHAASAKSKCTYRLVPNGTTVQWTAFKYNNKTPVKGTFKKIRFVGSKEAPTLQKLAVGQRVEITGASVNTNNPGRDVTLSQFFFQKFISGNLIRGKVTRFIGTPKKGTLSIQLVLNGTTKTIQMPYHTLHNNVMPKLSTSKKDTKTKTTLFKLQAHGQITMQDFALKQAFDTIEKACKMQHTSPDGSSKLWPIVELNLDTQFQEICTQ